MFTYISEHHPSVQIQLCPIYNLRLKPYDVRDAEWIPESSHDNEFTMQMSHKTRFKQYDMKALHYYPSSSFPPCVICGSLDASNAYYCPLQFTSTRQSQSPPFNSKKLTEIMIVL